MPKTTWSPQFFGTSRGRIIKLLCFGDHSVAELASRLGITDNAVRAHLAALVRDDLVEKKGLKRGLRRPNAVFHLTPRGHQLFPKAYGVVLKHLADVLFEWRPSDTRKLFIEAGRRVAESRVSGIRSLNRKQRLATLMEALEPAAELQRDGKRLLLRGCGCPLAAVVASHPELCQLAAEFLTELLGRPVREQCERAPSPRCCFVLSGV
jgi:predicted ArsR family transcriptional regulator